MSSIPDPSQPECTPTDPALWHPSWCDPKSCTAGDRLSSYHKSEPAIVAPRHPYAGPTITAQIWQDADEPDTTALASVVITFDETMDRIPRVHAYDLDPEVLRNFVDVIVPLRLILDARGAR